MNRKIPFTKMHGCGNDYIYVNTMLHDVPNPQAAAVAWSDRHKGIGSDGLVLIGRSPVPEADFSMRIFNADGSEAMMCGNASRCIGKYLYERGLTDKTEIRLLTLSGVKVLELSLTPNPSTTGAGSGCRQIVESVTVDMGEPVFEDESLYNPAIGNRLSAPLSSWEGCGRTSIARDGGAGASLFVSMGNPHYVIFTEDVDQVGEAGRALEHHPAFPQRCNIEFAKIGEPGADGRCSIRTRVWERGSGITQACGTGACATAVAAALTGRAGRKSQIVMDGGTLEIEWRESDGHVCMTGPAAFVFDGEIDDCQPCESDGK